MTIPPEKGTHARFEPTHWSVVLAAAGHPSLDSTAALEKLCAAYWYPIYAFLRRKGHSRHEAEDLTQGLFVHLLHPDRLQTVEPGKGCFRAFLLACLDHHVRDERDHAQAVKRGGATVTLPIDALEAEQRYQLEPADVADPARLFDRRWAYELAGQVMTALQTEYTRAGKALLYERLHHHLSSEPPPGFYPQAAADMNMGENALRTALYRLRRRFGAKLRDAVARTVSDPAEIDAEIRHLFAALGE